MEIKLNDALGKVNTVLDELLFASWKYNRMDGVSFERLSPMFSKYSEQFEERYQREIGNFKCPGCGKYRSWKGGDWAGRDRVCSICSMRADEGEL